MAKSVLIIAVVSALLLSSTLTAALECYQCSGAMYPNANCVTLNFVTPSICRPGTVCAKFVLTKGTADVLTRACEPENICSELEIRYANNPEVNVKECQVCSEDGCNA